MEQDLLAAEGSLRGVDGRFITGGVAPRQGVTDARFRQGSAPGHGAARSRAL
jgi:hypothetical protein